MRVLLLGLMALSVAGCGLIYKLPTRQGNVIEQNKLDQLKPGMTKEQVRFLLGTPIATSPFRDDRWEYIGYYKSPRGQVSSRTVKLYFNGEQLARMDGVERSSAAGVNDTPDLETIRRQEDKEKQSEREAPQSGVILTPPQY